MPILALTLILLKPPDIGQRLRRDLESTLRGLAPNSPRFKEKVKETLSRYPGFIDSDRPLDARGIKQPIGWPSATVITPYHSDINLLAFKVGKVTKVQLITDDPALYFLPTDVARIGLDLVQFGYYAGADHEINVGRVFHRTGGKWRKVQSIEAYSENPGVDTFKVHQGTPATISFSMFERVEPRNIRDECHACPWLRYQEKWVFANGRIRRVSLKRQPTPLAELDDLTGLIRRNERTQFRKRVPRSIQSDLWTRLRVLASGDAGVEAKDGKDGDGCRILGTPEWTATFARVRNGWRITQFRKRGVRTE